MNVRAPASSANLGPGFDTLGLALELPFELAVGGSPADGFLRVSRDIPPRSRSPRRAAIRHPPLVAEPDPARTWARLLRRGARRGAFAASRGSDEAFATRSPSSVTPTTPRPRPSAVWSPRHPAAPSPCRPGADLEVVVWWPETETSTNAPGPRCPRSSFVRRGVQRRPRRPARRGARGR